VNKNHGAHVRVSTVYGAPKRGIGHVCCSLHKSMAAAASSDAMELPGRLHNLTPEQAALLEQARAKLTPEQSALTPDHDLLRFLRARKWDLQLSLDMLTATLQWRKDNNVDTILTGPPLPEDRLKLLLQLVSQSHHGFDKQGRPLYIEKTGSIPVTPMLSSFNDSEMLHAHIWGMEWSAKRCDRVCDELLPVPAVLCMSVHREYIGRLLCVLFDSARESSAKLGRNVESFTTIMVRRLSPTFLSTSAPAFSLVLPCCFWVLDCIGFRHVVLAHGCELRGGTCHFLQDLSNLTMDHMKLLDFAKPMTKIDQV
jgi:hypothetical protein